MTTPGSHNDTYAESYHRDFFKNWAAGVPPEKCRCVPVGCLVLHNSSSRLYASVLAGICSVILDKLISFRCAMLFTPRPADLHTPAFATWPRSSRGTEGHNTASIGGFVTLPPVILGSLREGVEAAQVRAACPQLTPN